MNSIQPSQIMSSTGFVSLFRAVVPLMMTFLIVLPAARTSGQDQFNGVVSSLQEKTDKAYAELSELRNEIKTQKVPMTRDLGELEDELIEVRKEYDRVLRIRDGRSLDLSNLKAQIEARKKQNEYLVNLLDEYVRNMESRLHVSEAQLYRERIDEDRNDAMNSNLSQSETFQARLDLLDLSLERLDAALGGKVFEGSAADPSGVLHDGKFLILGPVAYFSTEDGMVQGLADDKVNSNEPVVTPFPGDVKSELTRVIFEGQGILPVDPTLGQAVKVSETKQTPIDEIKKGGYVMVPLLTLAGLSLLIGLIKWLRFSAIGLISPRRFARIMEHLDEGRQDDALMLARKVSGPEGKMMVVGIQQYKSSRSMVEEILFERILQAKSKLNSMLPFISITAAAAPLLGLLGTVTGMINTFKQITIFGTGDASKFSSGISEALITTKWGLIVAIPSLILYGFLSRKAKSVVDHMEQLAINFLNSLANDSESKDGSTTAASNSPGSASAAKKKEPSLAAASAGASTSGAAASVADESEAAVDLPGKVIKKGPSSTSPPEVPSGPSAPGAAAPPPPRKKPGQPGKPGGDDSPPSKGGSPS